MSFESPIASDRGQEQDKRPGIELIKSRASEILKTWDPEDPMDAFMLYDLMDRANPHKAENSQEQEQIYRGWMAEDFHLLLEMMSRRKAYLNARDRLNTMLQTLGGYEPGTSVSVPIEKIRSIMIDQNEDVRKNLEEEIELLEHADNEVQKAEQAVAELG